MNVNNRYRALNAYIEAKKLVVIVYVYLKKFPREEQYALCDQLRRAAISIPSNIAEGMGRYSIKEQIHFLEIAFGSLLEISAQMDVACDLNYISKEEQIKLDEQIDIVAALLSGLRNKRINSNHSSNNPLAPTKNSNHSSNNH